MRAVFYVAYAIFLCLHNVTENISLPTNLFLSNNLKLKHSIGQNQWESRAYIMQQCIFKP